MSTQKVNLPHMALIHHTHLSVHVLGDTDAKLAEFPSRPRREFTKDPQFGLLSFLRHGLFLAKILKQILRERRPAAKISGKSHHQRTVFRIADRNP